MPSLRYLYPYKLIIIVIVIIFFVIAALLSQWRELPIDPRYHILNRLPLCHLEKEHKEPQVNISQMLKDFGYCINPIMEKWRNNTKLMYKDLMETAICDTVFETRLNLTPLSNSDETKWVILPSCKEENIMVTLGIGKDTLAEERLNKLIPNTKFFGADPTIDPNRGLYSKFGKFFPFAVGKKAGVMKFWVLDRWYHYDEVTTIPFTFFLSDILGLKKIDMIWIDIEGGELEILDQFHRGGELDKKAVTICQFNIEIHFDHYPELANAFHDFMFRVLAEQRYVFMKPDRPLQRVHRLFFVNVESKECARKFIL